MVFRKAHLEVLLDLHLAQIPYMLSKSHLGHETDCDAFGHDENLGNTC